jgi:hypothetical protein
MAEEEDQPKAARSVYASVLSAQTFEARQSTIPVDSERQPAISFQSIEPDNSIAMQFGGSFTAAEEVARVESTPTDAGGAPEQSAELSERDQSARSTPADGEILGGPLQPLFTFLKFFVAILTASGLGILIVCMIRHLANSRKDWRLIFGRRTLVAANIHPSTTQPSRAPVSPEDRESRQPADTRKLLSSEPEDYIEGSVQRLLQELSRRQRDASLSLERSGDLAAKRGNLRDPKANSDGKGVSRRRHLKLEAALVGRTS